MSQSDFNWVGIHHNFTISSPTVTKIFPIDGKLKVTDDGYLLIQASGVSLKSHKISINGTELGGADILTSSSGPHIWMDGIPKGILKEGDNTITITRVGNDDFRVAGVVVNWRE